ncbi:MAG: thiamine biosynthesis protein ThiJ [Rhodospirillaceae bacterium]|mgnify:FL=1|nr:thiamine biosynthesis protein ThiJ [Rhodospirillaceae bacterium]MDG1887696.1 DJ-1/PfpI family protein [Alphaproteobacteria bacterium]|tara:strand:- start:28 stop:624 length:597 start_codon:yes stop_codon:yes gene_type:complete
MSYTTGILLFDQLEELDAIGPWEVFTMAANVRGSGKVVTISEHGDLVKCAKGLRIQSDYSFGEAPALDVILVPGGMGTRTEVNNKVVIDWIAKVAPGCIWVTSVCTGSMLLIESGVARGKRVTTHWAFVDTLRERGGAATVVDDMRFVRDGNIVSSAGVSAGIDMSLWIIGQTDSPAFAREVQKRIEYYPAPPYTSDV